ncbi:MAG: DUF1924 domain-containing protein [Thiogranum sp.]
MKNPVLIAALIIAIPADFALAGNAAIDRLLQDYAARGAAGADAARGKRMWDETFRRDGEFPQRSCSSCHTTDLTASGRHVRTNREIKPMAPAANPKRLTDVKKIEKWFKRNCKWTLGRECSAREKADFLAYINNPS